MSETDVKDSPEFNLVFSCCDQGHPGREGTPGEKGMLVSPGFNSALVQTQAAKSFVSDMMEQPHLTPSQEILSLMGVCSFLGSSRSAGPCGISWTTRS